MTIIEHISLLQRITGAMKTDITNGDKEKALSKMEILEGELGVFRESFTSQEGTVNNEPVIEPLMMDNSVIDAEATEVVDSSNEIQM